MSLRLASLSLSSSLLSIAALAGCSESESRARFADATPEQLDRAYTASTGLDLVSALSFAGNFWGRNEPMGCPAIVTTGLDTAVTGGCVTENGERFDGSIAIHNLPDFDGTPPDDPTQPSSVELDFQATSSTGERIAYNGRVELDFRSMRIQGDLTLDLDDLESTSRVTLDCGVGPCTASPGSEIEISGLGGASVEGTWRFDDSPSGRVTVRGADVLVLDMAGRDGRCVPYQIGDKRGLVCEHGLFSERSFASVDGEQVPAEVRPPR